MTGVSPREGKAMKGSDQADIERDAMRWRALMLAPRIQMRGSAGVDPKTGERTQGTHVHFSADFWSLTANEEPDGQSGEVSTRWGRFCLAALADAIIEDRAALDPQGEASLCEGDA